MTGKQDLRISKVGIVELIKEETPPKFQIIGFDIMAYILCDTYRSIMHNSKLNKFGLDSSFF